MKRCISVIAVALAMLASSVSVSADDQHSRTRHFLFHLSSADFGSCGNVWANDTFLMDLSVRQTSKGTIALERRSLGTFVTTGPVSPGACDPGTKHGQVVRAGIKGGFLVDLKLTVHSTVFKPDAVCGNDPNECFDLIFGDGVTAVELVSYRADYVAGDQGLIYHHWFQGSTPNEDRGDIASPSLTS